MKMIYYILQSEYVFTILIKIVFPLAPSALVSTVQRQVLVSPEQE